MHDRKPYHRKVTIASTWTLKAIGLVIAGAATVIVAMTIAKNVSTKVEPAPDGKFVGVRHEASPVSTAANTTSVTPDQTAALSPNTVVQNGMTVVSPELRVPVIDLDALHAATGSTDTASSKSSNARKRSRYVKRSSSQHHPRWKAYGLALR